MIGDDDDDDFENPELDDESDESGGGTAGKDGPGGDEGSEGDASGDLSPEHAGGKADAGDEGKRSLDDDGGKPSRGETRFQRLANEAKQAREDAAKARREAEDLRRQQWQRDQTLTEQQERERLSLMTADERAEYRIDKMQREMAQARHQDRLAVQMQMDKTAYDAKATINPVYARFQDEVEERFQSFLAKGAPVEREVLLKYLLGERALSGAANKKTARDAKRRVEAQRTPPSSGKGDAAAQRQKSGDTPESRLKDVYL